MNGKLQLHFESHETERERKRENERKRERVRQQTWLNSIIYYSSARGFDLASRPHSLTRSGTIRFLKGDSPHTVSSFIYYPSFSVFGETHPCIYIFLRMTTYTYLHTHPLVKVIKSLGQDAVHLHFDLKREKPSIFLHLNFFFSTFSPFLGRLSLSSALQIQMQFLNFKVLYKRGVLRRQQSTVKTIVWLKWM